jgi:hypothetical protein
LGSPRKTAGARPSQKTNDTFENHRGAIAAANASRAFTELLSTFNRKLGEISGDRVCIPYPARAPSFPIAAGPRGNRARSAVSFSLTANLKRDFCFQISFLLVIAQMPQKRSEDGIV